MPGKIRSKRQVLITFSIILTMVFSFFGGIAVAPIHAQDAKSAPHQSGALRCACINPSIVIGLVMLSRI